MNECAEQLIDPLICFLPFLLLLVLLNLLNKHYSDVKVFFFLFCAYTLCAAIQQKIFRNNNKNKIIKIKNDN